MGSNSKSTGKDRVKMNERHECETIQKSRVPISIEKIGKQWYWILWGKKKNEANGIRFCPYCGKELE